MKHKILIALLLVLVSGCFPFGATREQKIEACMYGCFAGMNYDGEFQEVDIDAVTEQQLTEFEDCENHTLVSRSKRISYGDASAIIMEMEKIKKWLLAHDFESTKGQIEFKEGA